MGIRSALAALFRSEPPRRRRSYTGANLNRLTADWVATGTNADSEIKGSLRPLRNRTRQLVRDNDYARNAIRSIVNNVVGTGVTFQSQVKLQRGGRIDPRLTEQIELAWHNWCKSPDASGQLSFQDLERLAIRSVAESGEVLIRLLNRNFDGGILPFSVQILESDLLLDDYNAIAPNGNQIRMGVEKDNWGRPVAYYFMDGLRHPGDYMFADGRSTSSKYLRIPAEDMIHLYVIERPGQSRGVPWLASSIERLHHMAGFEQSEVVAARASASIMGFVSSPDGELYGDEHTDDERLTVFEPGIFKYLAPGEQIQVPQLERSGDFEAFMRSMIRGVAAGIGCSYEAVSGDYSQSNYSSSRLSLLAERDSWRVLQNWLIRNFHERLFNRWLDAATLSGILNLPSYETNKVRYQAAKWIPRSWAWVDPQKEIVAAKEAERAGYITKSQIIAENGGDLNDLFLQRQSEIEMANDLGLAFDTDVLLVSNRAPAAYNVTDANTGGSSNGNPADGTPPDSPTVDGGTATNDG